MDLQGQNILTNTVSSWVEAAEEYSALLTKYRIEYISDGCYLKVGENLKQYGWILHVTAIVSQFQDLFLKIVPKLIQEGVPFKVVANKTVAKDILSGRYGTFKLGKLFCIYPDNEQIFSIAEFLITLSRDLQGPSVLTDFYLGGTIYARYQRPIVALPDATGPSPKSYAIPCELPEGIQWPFNPIAISTLHTQTSGFVNKYKQVEILKEDFSGKVFKALVHKNSILPAWCLIKQGRAYMLSDDNGRDIRDRIKWQDKVQRELYDKVNVPKVYALIQENNEVSLVMEYITGKKIDEVSQDILLGRTWANLSVKEKSDLLKYATLLLDSISAMHQYGYLHRDITPANFIVTKAGKLVIVDLELSYSSKDKKPSPPFELGTPWFMSPEQLQVKIPTEKEDIYALGSTLIAILTGLWPSKFCKNDSQLFKNQLSFFIDDTAMVDMLIQCFDDAPQQRPGMDQLQKIILDLRTRVISSKIISTGHSKLAVPQNEEVRSVIQKGLLSLAGPPLKRLDQFWTSKVQQSDQSIEYGFLTGASGVLYTMLQASLNLFPGAVSLADFINFLQYIDAQHILNKEDAPSGLYQGTSGIAILLTNGIESGLIKDLPKALLQMRNCFQNKSVDGWNVSTGLSGLGISLLECSSHLGEQVTEPMLRQIVDPLLQHQQKDGSWLFPAARTGNFSKITGYSNGVAGIICFLLAYASIHKRNECQYAATRGLEWLKKQARKQGQGFIWYTDDTCKRIDLGLNEGIAGITLAFLKGFEIIGDPGYKEVAEKALNTFSRSLTIRDYSLANGMVGIGEVYMDAFEITQNTEWLDRAGWIANVLLHTYQQTTEKLCYWIIDNMSDPTADMIAGNSGVIHFLIRYCCPGAIPNPLLPIRYKSKKG